MTQNGENRKVTKILVYGDADAAATFISIVFSHIDCAIDKQDIVVQRENAACACEGGHTRKKVAQSGTAYSLSSSLVTYSVFETGNSNQ